MLFRSPRRCAPRNSHSNRLPIISTAAQEQLRVFVSIGPSMLPHAQEGAPVRSRIPVAGNSIYFVFAISSFAFSAKRRIRFACL